MYVCRCDLLGRCTTGRFWLYSTALELERQISGPGGSSTRRCGGIKVTNCIGSGIIGLDLSMLEESSVVNGVAQVGAALAFFLAEFDNDDDDDNTVRRSAIRTYSTFRLLSVRQHTVSYHTTS